MLLWFHSDVKSKLEYAVEFLFIYLFIYSHNKISTRLADVNVFLVFCLAHWVMRSHFLSLFVFIRT